MVLVVINSIIEISAFLTVIISITAIAAGIINSWVIAIWVSNKRATKIPVPSPFKKNANRTQDCNNNALYKPWLFVLISLLIVAYLLDTILNPGPITRMAVFKIVFGVVSFYIWAILAVTIRTFHVLSNSDHEVVD